MNFFREVCGNSFSFSVNAITSAACIKIESAEILNIASSITQLI